MILRSLPTLFAVASCAVAIASAGIETAADALPTGDCDSLYWDLTARFDSGDRLYARILVTNEGPGEHTAAAAGHWIEADGHVTPFQNGRREGRWEASPGAQRIRIGSTVLDRREGAIASSPGLSRTNRSVSISPTMPATA